MISEPAVRSGAPSDASDGQPSALPPARLRRQPARLESTSGNDPLSNSHEQSDSKHSPGLGSESFNASSIRQQKEGNRWLELCIRSGPDTYELGELDLAGRQTDNTVFSRIREMYVKSRVSARLFGRLALRVPNVGVFVQVSTKPCSSNRLVGR